MSPVELVKVKQQVIGVDLIKTTGEVSRGLLSHVGWKGLGATLWRDGIPHGVWFASYQWCKDILESKIGGTPRHDSVTIPLTSGAFAATTAWAVGYPFDLIKTRIQVSPNPQGIIETAMELRQEPGGLYRGFGLKLVRAIPASMIGFTVYEFVKGQMIVKGEY
jgi:solute carrier family 25 carnitine/acylcarnitine transporter 20/29